MKPWVWWLGFITMQAVGLFGDVALKRAGTIPAHKGWFAVGMLTYASTAFGWLLLMRGRKLSSFGTLSPVANALGLVIVGVVFLGERLGPRELLGIAGGIAVCVLLGGR